MHRLGYLNKFVFALIVTLPFSSIMAGTVHGVLKVVKGDVKIVQASDKNEIKAKLGQKVFPMDTIIAGKDSRAKIVMVDNNEINVSPDSKIQIENYEFKPNEDKKNVLINVLYGKVRAKVNQKYDGENKFQVRTPTAVAGVRGTDFITSFDRGGSITKVVTFQGHVAFGAPGPGGQILNPVMVNVGQTTSMSGNAPPPPPVSVPRSEMAQMDNQSDAEKAPEPSAADGRQPADSGDKGKKDDDKKGPPKGDGRPDQNRDNANSQGPGPNGQAPGPNAGERAPQALPPDGGSMIKPGDLAGAPNPAIPPVLPTAGVLPIGPVPLPPTNLLPRNDFLNDLIGTRRRLIINVTTGP